MEPAKQIKWFVIKWAAGLNLVLMVGMMIFFDTAAVFGIFVGGLASIINFHLLELTLQKSVNYSPKKAAAYTFVQYILRYILLFIVLYIAFKRPDVNIITAIVGTLTVKAVILLGNVFKVGEFEVKPINSAEGRENE